MALPPEAGPGRRSAPPPGRAAAAPADRCGFDVCVPGSALSNAGSAGAASAAWLILVAEALSGNPLAQEVWK